METEVDKLEGRALDAAIAERVMGWVSLPGYNYWMTLYGDGNFDLHALKATWNPSGELRQAWQVVEKLIADRCMFRLGFTGTGYYFELSVPDGKFPIFDSGSQTTAPLAICRTALLAQTQSSSDAEPTS
jgi:hypothetical protein